MTKTTRHSSYSSIYYSWVVVSEISDSIGLGNNGVTLSDNKMTLTLNAKKGLWVMARLSGHTDYPL